MKSLSVGSGPRTKIRITSGTFDPRCLLDRSYYIVDVRFPASLVPNELPSQDSSDLSLGHPLAVKLPGSSEKIVFECKPVVKKLGRQGVIGLGFVFSLLRRLVFPFQAVPGFKSWIGKAEVFGVNKAVVPELLIPFPKERLKLRRFEWVLSH